MVFVRKWTMLTNFHGIMLLLRAVWSFKESVCCACDPSLRLHAHSICFVCACVCRKLSPHLRAGSHVSDHLMLFLCVIVHTMWSGKSL